MRGGNSSGIYFIDLGGGNMRPALSETVTAAEEIQEHVLRQQGYDLKVLVEEISQDHSPGIKFGERQDTEEIDDKNIDEYLSNIFNEVAYNKSAEFVDYFNNPSFTKYDKTTLLQRFPNIVALCDDYFEQPDAAKKVFLSTLPLIQINGLNIKFENDEVVIFLNEGLLYSAQFLIWDFYKVPFHAGNIIANGEVNMTEEEQADFSRTCPVFLDGFFAYMSDTLTTNTMMDGNAKHLPSAHENWKFFDLLKSQVEENLLETQGIIPQEKTRSRREKMFYINKGFFILLVGHEYSHHFRGHHDIRDKGEPIINQFEMHRVLRELRESGHSVSFPDAMNPYFSLYQPLEFEADLDAFNILQKYCRDNRLNKEQIDDLTYGFVLCFIFMEFSELFSNAKKYNADYADHLYFMDHQYRNIITSSEHPCPMSRAAKVVEKAENTDGELLSLYINNMQQLSYKATLIWKYAFPSVDRILRKIDFGQAIDLDAISFSKSYTAMGHILSRD